MALEFHNHEQCGHLTSAMMGTALANSVSYKRYQAGHYIWRIGSLPDCVYRLKRGRVNVVSIDASGNELLLRSIEPEEMFGEVCFCAHRSEPHGVVARATTECEIAAISYGEFLGALRDDPDFAESLVTEFCVRLGDLEKRTQILALHDASDRLRQLLLFLARSHKVSAVNDRGTVSLAITHSELAAMSALSRPHVSLLMTRFRQRGWVTYKRNTKLRVHVNRVDF
jgi:CRP/FNR family transcriptional regulator, cyclic AMP receptor protein